MKVDADVYFTDANVYFTKDFGPQIVVDLHFDALKTRTQYSVTGYRASMKWSYEFISESTDTPGVEVQVQKFSSPNPKKYPLTANKCLQLFEARSINLVVPYNEPI